MTEQIVQIDTQLMALNAPLVRISPFSKVAVGVNGKWGEAPASEFKKSPNENYGLVCRGFEDWDWDVLEISPLDLNVVADYEACKSSGTWAQRTGGNHRGEQYLFTAIAPRPRASHPIIGESTKIKYGEIISGEHYVLMPGSVVRANEGVHTGELGTYERINEGPPIGLPLALTRSGNTRCAPHAPGNSVGDSTIAGGGAAHRNVMLKLTAAYREIGLDVQTTQERLYKWQFDNQDLLEGFDPSNPFSRYDLFKMAEGWNVNEELMVTDLISWEFIAANPMPPVRHYVYELGLRVGSGPVLLTGHSGSYKTALILHLAECLANGTPVFGKFMVSKRPDRVVFLSIDMPKEDAWRRIGNLPGVPSDRFLFADWSTAGYSAKRFKELLANNPDSYIMVDCYADIASSSTLKQNDYEGTGTRQLISSLRQAFALNHCDGIIADHTTRPNEKSPKAAMDNTIGSAQKRATFRGGLTMRTLFEKEMAALPEPSFSEEEQKTTYCKLETLKAGESGTIDAVYLAFLQTVNYGPLGEILGAAYTPVTIEPPGKIVPLEELTEVKQPRQTRADLLLSVMVPGQEYTTTELSELSGIQISNMSTVMKNLTLDARKTPGSKAMLYRTS